MDIKKAKVLGYPVSLCSYDEAVDLVCNSDNFMQIVTINPEMIELAQKNKEFDELLKSADLVVPDGVGIKIALKLRKINQEQIAGCEFAKTLIEKAASAGEKIALVGAKQEVLDLCKEKLLEEFPNLQIVYSQNGYFKEDEEQVIIENIKNSGAKYLFVALGAPKQEFFIKKCKEFGCNVKGIGVGGSFDVWAGIVLRAPKIWQKLGLEWLYRTLKQPSRFKRIFPTLPLFLFKVIMSSRSECERNIEK